jgi:5'-methylthioinosine phosphorylase
MPEKYALVLGSGFDSFTTDVQARRVETRFGLPSAAVREADIEGQRLLTLARHGEPHTIPPHAINYRANMAAFKDAGATHIIALNTVGIVSDFLACGEIALPDQILDYTWGRAHSIYDGLDDKFDHIEFDQPFSTLLRAELLQAASRGDIDCYDGGVYATMQGPRLETIAEVARVERDGADYVGMTAMPEASIARELGLEYVCLALVVNHAAGRGEGPIHADIEANSLSARTQAKSLLAQFFRDKSNDLQ